MKCDSIPAAFFLAFLCQSVAIFLQELIGGAIGMITVMKTDYYPLPEIYPWISTLFVSEKFRGKRISQKLIEAAEEYARASGFEKTYIPTEFVGLYEKYGYSYVRDIENYGGGVDRLYAKEI
ncbi:GNAT family N-acetyltransferase [Ruminococcus sp. XPD3002]|uniref:GNAT family N-acetyltransferase n=1 Tax=Ruminococcus sp. XPD3002 TaxID=1452269 RepID=UPI00094DA6F6